MKPRLLFLDEIDRPCHAAQTDIMQALLDAKLTEGSWLRRMWWKLSGRGPRYAMTLRRR